MSDVPMFVIAANRITAQQREQIQAIVKAHANGWWHSFSDLWIVGGKTAIEWRDLVGVVAPFSEGAGVLVLKIDTASDKTWAFRAKMSKAGRAWIRKNL
jgi:hypothetical protein